MRIPHTTLEPQLFSASFFFPIGACFILPSPRLNLIEFIHHRHFTFHELLFVVITVRSTVGAASRRTDERERGSYEKMKTYDIQQSPQEVASWSQMRTLKRVRRVGNGGKVKRMPTTNAESKCYAFHYYSWFFMDVFRVVEDFYNYL